MRRKGFKLHPVLHSANLIEDHLRNQLAPLGIGPRQARILEAMSRMGACSQVDLAREFSITPASMSTMTARLVAAGHIERRPDPDERRSNILRLTASGETLLSDVRVAWTAVDQIIEEAIGADQAEQLADLALALRIALGGRVPGSDWQKRKSAQTNKPASQVRKKSRSAP